MVCDGDGGGGGGNGSGDCGDDEDGDGDNGSGDCGDGAGNDGGKATATTAMAKAAPVATTTDEDAQSKKSFLERKRVSMYLNFATIFQLERWKNYHAPRGKRTHEGDLAKAFGHPHVRQPHFQLPSAEAVPRWRDGGSSGWRREQNSGRPLYLTAGRNDTMANDSKEDVHCIVGDDRGGVSHSTCPASVGLLSDGT